MSLIFLFFIFTLVNFNFCVDVTFLCVVKLTGNLVLTVSHCFQQNYQSQLFGHVVIAHQMAQPLESLLRSIFEQTNLFGRVYLSGNQDLYIALVSVRCALFYKNIDFIGREHIFLQKNFRKDNIVLSNKSSLSYSNTTCSIHDAHFKSNFGAIGFTGLDFF